MKYLVINVFSLLLLLFNYVYSQTNTKFNIIGSLSEKMDGLVYISYINMKNNFVTDSARIEDTLFNLSGDILSPTTAVINVVNKGLKIPFNENSNLIFIEPQNLQLNINLNMPYSLKLLGSQTQYEFIKAINNNKLLSNKITEIENKMPKASIQNSNRYTKLIDYYNLKIQENNILFIKKYPQSYVSSYLLYNLIYSIPMKEIKKLFKTINTPRKTNFYTNQIFYEIKNYDSISVKKTAEDFTSQTPNAKPVTLSKILKKKSAALIFWASWCKPCISEMSTLKYLKPKYKNIEFLLVSADDDDTTWKNSIIHNKLSNFLNIRSKQINSDLSSSVKSIMELYEVTAIPCMILISSKNIIVGRYWQLNEFKRELEKFN